jgi:hypothetical protein
MSGNQGDQGDQGDQGNLSVSGGGAFVQFVDRFDFPFISAPHVADQATRRTGFGSNWATEWEAWCTLADFAQTDWRNILANAVPPPAAPTDEERQSLLSAALEERADALGEIAAQQSEFISYYLAVMGSTTSARRASMLVFHIANLAGTLAVMHFKKKYDRVRPSQLWPGLLPPLTVPGHASYPSGHATQAHLFAKCAVAMMPAAERDSIKVVLEALAERIARNREIAGLHYPSDSTAGKSLAEGVFGILSNEDLMPHAAGQPSQFAAAMAKARAEWA